MIRVVVHPPPLSGSKDEVLFSNRGSCALLFFFFLKKTISGAKS